MIDVSDVGNRERKKSKIIFQISGVNNWGDGVLFIRKKDIKWRNSLGSNEEQNWALDMFTMATRHPSREALNICSQNI